MLRRISIKQRECLQRAADCRRRATETADPVAKSELLDLERSWRLLAQSYEFANQPAPSADEAKNRAKPRAPR